MKKIITASLLVLFSADNAQVTRFVYQLNYKPSTESTDRRSENLYLDAAPEKSVFYSEMRMKRDSVMDRVRQSGNFDPSQMRDLGRSKLNYTVEKDMSKGTVLYKDRIGRDAYQYTEKPDLQWKILPETTQIGDMKVQKAETSYGGRSWTAWFNTDFPYHDGPYKFSGLPGMIVKLEDSSGDYQFDLKQTQKLSELPQLQSRGPGGQAVTLTKEKYAEQYRKYQKDPVSFMEAQQSLRGSGGRPTPPMGAPGRGGNMPNAAEFRQRAIDEVKENNNPIELK